MARESRRVRYEHLDLIPHLQSLDSDTDALEFALNGLREEVAAGFTSLRGVMVGLLIAITTAAIVGTIDILSRR